MSLQNLPRAASFLEGRLVVSSTPPGRPSSGKFHGREVADHGVLGLKIWFGTGNGDRGPAFDDNNLKFAPSQAPLLSGR